jgi:hypothetical protein
MFPIELNLLKHLGDSEDRFVAHCLHLRVSFFNREYLEGNTVVKEPLFGGGNVRDDLSGCCFFNHVV